MKPLREIPQLLCVLALAGVALVGNAQYGGMFSNDNRIVSATLVDGKLEIVHRQTSNEVLLSNPPQAKPDTIWKDIYVASEGKIIFEKRIDGRVYGPTTTPEKIEWEEVK